MSVERIDAYPFSMDGNSLNRIGIRYFLKSSESKFFSNSSWLSESSSCSVFPSGTFLSDLLNLASTSFQCLFFNWHIFAVQYYMLQVYNIVGFPGGASGKEPACQCRWRKTLGLDPWAWKIPRRRAWQPTPALLPGESHGQRSLAGYIHRISESQTQLKQLSTHTLTEPLWARVWSARLSVPWLGDHWGGTGMEPPLVHVSKWLWCLQASCQPQWATYHEQKTHLCWVYQASTQSRVVC